MSLLLFSKVWSRHGGLTFKLTPCPQSELISSNPCVGEVSVGPSDVLSRNTVECEKNPSLLWGVLVQRHRTLHWPLEIKIFHYLNYTKIWRCLNTFGPALLNFLSCNCVVSPCKAPEHRIKDLMLIITIITTISSSLEHSNVDSSPFALCFHLNKIFIRILLATLLFSIGWNLDIPSLYRVARAAPRYLANEVMTNAIKRQQSSHQCFPRLRLSKTLCVVCVGGCLRL